MNPIELGDLEVKAERGIERDRDREREKEREREREREEDSPVP